MSEMVDGVLLLDDSSTDNSVAVAAAHPSVKGIILNTEWSKERAEEETIHRHVLHQAGKELLPKWFFYFDADERFEGDIKPYLHGKVPPKIDAIRISLFDAYLTRGDQEDYHPNKPLYDLRKKFGPERRDILMIWRNIPRAEFKGLDAREPQGFRAGSVETRFFCQHYGKAISVSQWESTCDYYINNFPMYREKWKARKGKAIHTKSDFDHPLYTWEQVKNHAVVIHPV